MSYATLAAAATERLRERGEALILSVESSCDDTSMALVRNGREVVSCVMSSQLVHARFGGVVPEIASRQHVEALSHLAAEVLGEAGAELDDVDAIAVTYGPGLVGALLSGLSFAKALAFARGLPLVPVHHIMGHISANYIEDPGLEPPFLCLVVSGGHTLLARIEDYTRVRILGSTRDDAAGEAFDKGARILGLPYPGGKHLDTLAKKGDPGAFAFPKAKLDSPLDFSFSGIKTDFMQKARKYGDQWLLDNRCDLAASYQYTIVSMLTDASLLAQERTGDTRFALAGGVAANSLLRETLAKAFAARSVRFTVPSPALCTDNAAMIGSMGFYELMEGHTGDLSTNASPHLPLPRV